MFLIVFCFLEHFFEEEQPRVGGNLRHLARTRYVAQLQFIFSLMF